MVLVDEYDRAPMDMFASISADNATDIAKSLEPATAPLKDFLFTLKNIKARYYVTGIFSVPDLLLSIFNDSFNLTNSEEFAHAFGMTGDCVRYGLREFVGIKDEDEVDRAVKWLRNVANGYSFFGSQEPIFNAQLIHLFFTNYNKSNYRDELPTMLVDHNQIWSANQLQIARHTPELSQRLLGSCLSGESFKDTIRTSSNKIHPETYLFQLGVLSLRDCRVKYCEGGNFDFFVPNAYVRRNYAQSFLEHMEGDLGTPCAFVAEPTAAKLVGRLEKLMQKKVWKDTQTECDSQIVLAADMVFNSPVDVGGKHHPGFNKNKNKNIDIKVLVPGKHIIIIEVKVVKAGSSKCTQRLHMDVAESLGLVMTGEGESYPQTGLRNLSDLSVDELFALGTVYNGKSGYADTVGAVHQQSSEEARDYATAEFKCQSTSDNPLRVVAFSVTQVCNRPHVELVYDSAHE